MSDPLLYLKELFTVLVLSAPPPLNHDETGRRNSRISVRWSEVPVATRAVPKQVMIEVDGGAGQRPRSGR